MDKGKAKDDEAAREAARKFADWVAREELLDRLRQVIEAGLTD